MIPSYFRIDDDTTIEFSIKAQIIISANDESHTLLLGLPAILNLMNKLKALADVLQAARTAETFG